MKHKIYCLNNGGPRGWLHAVALADDGHVLAGHICSDEYYMAGDLGITGTLKHDLYNAHFGEGNWELEWVANPDTHEGFKAAYELHKKLKHEVSEESK